MKVMEIEVLTRDGGDVLAVACPRSALLSEAGIGGGATEREAVIQAVNSYFKRQEQCEQANTLLAPVACRIQSTVAVSQHEIRALLREASKSSDVVRITGKKVNGDRYTDREVEPISITDGDYSLPATLRSAYLNCNTDDGVRSFRLDGIERAELVD